MNSLHKILMVEDDPDIQTVARMSLEAVGGFNVTVCSDGHQALECVGGVQPDLILLDVMMPDMDGPAVLARLRDNPETAAIPVIFVTAKAQAHEVASYYQMGALGVISKPFDPLTLPQSIRDIWDNGGKRGA